MEISQEQLNCLKMYADMQGRRWKQSLRNDWAKAAAVPQLQWLRNTHGPSWLAKFKFPKE